jgi:hypothetical protein
MPGDRVGAKLLGELVAAGVAELRVLAGVGGDRLLGDPLAIWP